MSTDHTSGSSLEAAGEAAAHQSFVLPGFRQESTAGAHHVSEAGWPDADQQLSESEQTADHPPAGHNQRATVETEPVSKGAAVAEPDSAPTPSPQQDEASAASAATEPDDREVEDSESYHHGSQDSGVQESGGPDRGVQDSEGPYAGQSLRESLQDDETDVVEFRVSRPGTPVRRLRLTGHRYTIGSADGCSIRLSDHALRPMHAVLIRDASRIMVRAYSIPIQVNGARLTEAELHAGDVLQLGSYRFELLSADEANSGPSRSTARSNRAWGSFSQEPSFRPIGNPSNISQRFEFGSNLGSADDLIWKERLRREIDQWRERQVECDRRESRCDEREASLRDRETELWSRAENLYRREARLQSQETAAFQLYDEFAKHQQELIQIREAAQRREDNFHQREITFRNQELEYRQRLDETNRQLHLAHQQADSASQAVARMRQQFDALNQQIEELSNQHLEIEQREQQQRSDHQRLLTELQESRDQAIEGRIESELKRQQAEAKLDELEAQLALLREDRGSDLVAQQSKLAESEQAAETLRQQVQELQQNLAKATEESSRLRADYEEAFATVVQLESIIAESSQASDQDRDGWEAEADELRASVERLSMELNKANRELTELRDANAQLTARLDDMQRQRDEARADADARPTLESLQAIQDELDAAKEQLTQTRNDYEATREQLNELQRDRERDQEKAAQDLAEALAAAEALRAEAAEAAAAKAAAEAKVAEGERAAAEARAAAEKAILENQQPLQEAISETPIAEQEAFDPEPDFNAQAKPWTSVDHADDEFVIEETMESLESEDDDEASSWNLESPNLQQSDLQQEDAPSDWKWGERDAADHRSTSSAEANEDADSQAESIWGTSAWSATESGDDTNSADESSELPADGSLASMLIRDLEQEERQAERSPEERPFDDDSEEVDAPAHAMADDTGNDSEDGYQQPWGQPQWDQAEWTQDPSTRRAWDLEHQEEAYATRWSNAPEGYRVEEIEASVADADPNSDLQQEASEFESGHPQEALPPDEIVHAGTNESSANNDADEEDSIEAYMNRLLRRVQGHPPEAESTLPSSKAPVVNVPTESEPPVAVAETPVEPFDPNAPFLPRSQAPERTKSLSAMRELANTSARMAISRSLRVQTRDTQLKGMFNMACAVGAIGCGIACYHFIPGVMRYLAVAMTIVVAMIYLREGWLLFREASRRLRAAEQGQLSHKIELEEDDDDPGVVAKA